MRNILAMGGAILLAGFASIAIAQERLPQHSGFGTGVGESSGVGTRSQVWDTAAFLERLSQPETIMGRIFAVDLAQHRLMIETGGVGVDEGQEGKAGYGARTIMTLHMTERSNIQQIRTLHVGDEVTIQAQEEITKDQPYGTGRKLVLAVTLLRGNEKLAGFGGLGQRPDPTTERGIDTENNSTHGGIVGQVLPGEIKSGIVSSIGEVTGAAPCWNCEPQPGWGYTGKSATDYGNPDKPNFTKQ